jgi:hypothetical protein
MVMPEPASSDLSERVAALERALETRSTTTRRYRRRARQLTVLAVTVLSIALPASMFANHIFSDVPSGGTFHDAITNVYNARITTGCGVGTYCPTNAVTREQMAGFLQRSSGRLGSGTRAYPGVDVGASPVVLAQAEVRAGNVQGGTAFILLTASITVYTNSATGLPIFGAVAIREYGGDALQYPNAWQIYALAGAAGADSATVVVVVEVPTGIDKVYELYAYRAGGSNTPKAYGSIAAAYFPFSGDGDNSIDIPKAPSPVVGPFLAN